MVTRISAWTMKLWSAHSVTCPSSLTIPRSSMAKTSVKNRSPIVERHDKVWVHPLTMASKCPYTRASNNRPEQEAITMEVQMEYRMSQSLNISPTDTSSIKLMVIATISKISRDSRCSPALNTNKKSLVGKRAIVNISPRLVQKQVRNCAKLSLRKEMSWSRMVNKTCHVTQSSLSDNTMMISIRLKRRESVCKTVFCKEMPWIALMKKMTTEMHY